MDAKVYSVEIIVRDLKKSVEWYRRLGAKVEKSYPEWRCVALKFFGARIELGEPVRGLSEPEFSREVAMMGKPTGILIEAKNIDRFCAQLKKLHVIVRGPINAPWGDRVAYFFDPDGNEFKVIEA